MSGLGDPGTGLGVQFDKLSGLGLAQGLGVSGA